jgi:hypothetical protein
VKFLCICAGGNIRSRAFVHRLMYTQGQDALSASHDKQSDGTLRILCEWADRIILIEPQYGARLPAEYRNKVKVLDVGPDVFGSPWHFLLQDKMRGLLDPWAAAGYPLSG